MKKYILLALSFISFSTLALAHETPAARLCRSVGGLAWTLDVGQVNDLQFCIIGASQIAAESLRRAVEDRQWDTAVIAFSSGPMSCAQAEGEEHIRKDSNGSEFHVCEFGDGSAIGVDTLESGKNSPKNTTLSAILGF